MKMFTILKRSLLTGSLATVVAVSGGSAIGQTATDTHATHNNAAKSGESDLASELQALRAKVGKLEAALQAQHQARYGTDASNQGMSMSGQADTNSSAMPGGMKGMGMKQMDAMDDDPKIKSGGMGGMKMMSGGGMGDKGMMSGGGMGMGGMSGGMGMGMMSGTGMGDMEMMSGGGMGMGGMSGGMGIGMMGRNPAMKSSSMGGMKMSSVLPGFPGASHLYHIGETGFYLDHPQHITLSDAQQQQLNQIKEQALLTTATAERKIDEAEQQLWMLTAEASPDINKIEAKTKEIGELNANKRIEFIRAVGKAAEVLTADQRQALVGMTAPTDTMTDH